MIRVFFLAMLVFVLTGCDSRSWQTKDISGMLPALQFNLSGTTNESLSAEDLRGNVVLLFFGFTSCPDVCPATMTRLATLRQQLPQPLRERIRIVFVSVDPERDTSEQLVAYGRHFGEGVTAVTGTIFELRQLARRYRTTFAYSERDENDHYDVSHSIGVYVFDAEGRARLLFRPDDPVTAMRSDLLQLFE